MCRVRSLALLLHLSLLFCFSAFFSDRPKTQQLANFGPLYLHSHHTEIAQNLIILQAGYSTLCMPVLVDFCAVDEKFQLIKVRILATPLKNHS